MIPSQCPFCGCSTIIKDELPWHIVGCINPSIDDEDPDDDEAINKFECKGCFRHFFVFENN